MLQDITRLHEKIVPKEDIKTKEEADVMRRKKSIRNFICDTRNHIEN